MKTNKGSEVKKSSNVIGTFLAKSGNILCRFLRFCWKLLNSVAPIAGLIIAIIALTSVLKIEGFQDLLKATSDQLSIQSKVDKSNVIGDAISLYNLNNKFELMILILGRPEYFNKSSRQQTITYLQDLKTLTDQGVSNSLLKMYEDIYIYWVVYSEQIETTIMSLTLDEKNIITKYYGTPDVFRIMSPSPEIPPPTKEELDLDDLKVFLRYSKTFYENGVKPSRDIPEVRTYAEKYHSITYLRKLESIKKAKDK